MQYEKGRVLADGTRARLKAIAYCIREQEIQEAALKAAISNLESFQTSISKRFTAFRNDYEQQSRRHQVLLQSFEQDLGKVRLTISLECLRCVVR